MRLIFNLASEDYRKIRLIRSLIYAGSLVLIGIGIFQVQAYLSYRSEHRAVEENLRKLERNRAALEEEMRVLGVDTSKEGIDAFAAKIGAVNEAISQKSFSWTRLLNELESTVPRNISLMKVEPKIPKGILTVTGKARSLKDLTRFMITLEESSVFEEVFLKGQETDKEGFVEFTVDFKYRPQGKTPQPA